MHEAADDDLTPARERRARGSSRTCCASWRRRSSACCVRRFRQFDACEDAVQEALVAAAAVQWPADGIPANPRGWLVTVASRRMTDHVRSESARRRREDADAARRAAGRALVAPAPTTRPWCRPARRHADAAVPVLPPVAVGAVAAGADAARRRRPHDRRDRPGLPRARVDDGPAHQPGQAAHQGGRRHVRAPPRPTSAAERLQVVLHVLYLVFNEGYTSSSGPDLQRTDLADEASA